MSDKAPEQQGLSGKSGLAESGYFHGGNPVSPRVPQCAWNWRTRGRGRGRSRGPGRKGEGERVTVTRRREGPPVPRLIAMRLWIKDGGETRVGVCV